MRMIPKKKNEHLTKTVLAWAINDSVVVDRFCSMNSFASPWVLNFLKIAPVNPFTCASHSGLIAHPKWHNVKIKTLLWFNNRNMIRKKKKCAQEMLTSEKKNSMLTKYQKCRHFCLEQQRNVALFRAISTTNGT